MSKKSKGSISPLTVIIRVLIVVIFCLALFIASNRIIEWNEQQREAARLEEERDRLEEELGESTP